MLDRRQIVPAALIFIAAAFALGTAPSLAPARDNDAPEEVARIRAHFDSVLGELQAANLTGLDPSQRAARAELIARLRQYSATGRFPHNHVRPGEYVSVFRDEHGTLCAMGFLVASTGRTDLVDAVAQAENLDSIRTIERGTLGSPLRAWLDSVGLTLGEAQRIQPQYGGGCGCCTICAAPPRDVEGHDGRRVYAQESGVATLVSGAAMAGSLTRMSDAPKAMRWWTALGLVSGAAQIAFGVEALRYQDTRYNMGLANFVVGTGSVASSVWRLRHPARSVAVTPTVSSDHTYGFVLAARF